ncbi:MAG: YraN family protein [Abitibacteriaceae bacterium]|nr:YraN family protein [Abditibacteriaceae bacterium]
MKLRQQRGQTGEDAAVDYLKAQGYRVVARNWRPGNSLRGEVDCIAWQGQTLCFIEVKTRTSLERGWPQEAVNLTKQRQLSRLANAYVSSQQLDDVPCRFDVVEVWLTPDRADSKAAPRIALRENAFDYRERSPRRSQGARIF